MNNVTALIPAFNKNNHLIVLAADNNYAPYLGVCLESIIENSKPQYNYDIVVLENNITTLNKQKIYKLFKNRHNMSLRFYNLDINEKQLQISLNKVHEHFSVATYFRIFAPQIFLNYNRMLYVDCDLIFIDDFTELLIATFDKKAIMAVQDFGVYGISYQKKSVFSYLTETLKIYDVSKYFQAGVMIWNLDQLRHFNFTEKCIKKLSTFSVPPRWVDQDIINSVMYGQIKYLDLKYNYTWHVQFDENKFQLQQIQQHTPSLYKQIKLLDQSSPIVVHFTSNKKPWKCIDEKYADRWWQYARQTPFYEEILYKNLRTNLVQNITQQITKVTDMSIVKDIANYSKNRFNYYRCKLMANLTFGKMRKHYKEKKRALKAKIKAVRRFLKGK